MIVHFTNTIALSYLPADYNPLQPLSSTRQLIENVEQFCNTKKFSGERIYSLQSYRTKEVTLASLSRIYSAILRINFFTPRRFFSAKSRPRHFSIRGYFRFSANRSFLIPSPLSSDRSYLFLFFFCFDPHFTYSYGALFSHNKCRPFACRE